MSSSAVATVNWADLLGQVSASTRAASLETLLTLWCESAGVESAALYLNGESLSGGPLSGGPLSGEPLGGEPLGGEPSPRRVASVGTTTLPEVLEPSDGSAFGRIDLAKATLLFTPASRAGDVGPASRPVDVGPIDVLLSQGSEIHRLRDSLRRKHFQDNYRLVELEAIYELGLAIASTLDLEQLPEEILLRAVSLCDARRGALYLLEGEDLKLRGTIGGYSVPTLRHDDPVVQQLLDGAEGIEQMVLPGADYPLAVPVEIEGKLGGLLAVADKESRQGVGPFLDADRRTLGLFANQAAIALENARLHQQALEKERLEREMELAAEIQQRLLPKGTPSLPGFEIAGWNCPAWQVGGDYYDFMALGGGRLGLVVADVTGKGMPAALLVSTLHSALRLLLEGSELGDSLFSQLNEHIVESSSPNKFITLILVELDPDSGVLRFLNAGHNPGLLVSADGSVAELTAGGMPLGLRAGTNYESQTLEMRCGDLLCLYSDGITECAAPDEEEFGLDRLRDLLLEDREKPLSAILERIEKATLDFADGCPQADDQTVVLLRRNP